jgi:UMP-CMP kinase family protein
MGCSGSQEVDNAQKKVANANKKVGDALSKACVVFVIGGPGSGKGTQCAKIKTEFNYNHLSTGDILRTVVKEQKAPGWQQLDSDMKEGKLIDSETLMKFIKFSIQGSTNKKILLDGFPRNKENLDCWNKNMGDVADVKGVLYFEVSDEEMKKRLLGRNEGRADDNEETIAKRLATFNNDTKPIIEYYEQQGNLIKIDASKTVDEIFNNVKTEFNNRKLN